MATILFNIKHIHERVFAGDCEQGEKGATVGFFHREFIHIMLSRWALRSKRFG